jgi:hypothetical protein
MEARNTMKRARVLAVVLTTVTTACLEEQCGLESCDPSKEDCSLSVTCCTPPSPSAPPVVPLGLACETRSQAGDYSFDMDLLVRGGSGPYRYAVTFGDGNSTDGTRNASAVGDDTRISIGHEYQERPGDERTSYTVQATVTDQQNQATSCTLEHLVDPQRLDLDCEATPRGGTAPLTVTFTGRPSGCIGPCEVTIEFGDGEEFAGRNAVRVYTAPGFTAQNTYPAGIRLEDGPGRNFRCPRPIQVLPGTETPPATPENRAPVIALFTATPGILFVGGPPATLTTVIFDPDGDPVTWTLSLDPSSTATGTFTAASGSGNVSSQFSAGPGPAGPAVLRLMVSDGRGGTAERTVSVNVILG